MNAFRLNRLGINRRYLFGRAGVGLAALATLLGRDSRASSSAGGWPGEPHFTPRARRVIYLFQSGAPSQVDLFDLNPPLAGLGGSDLPDSIRQRQRLTG